MLEKPAAEAGAGPAVTELTAPTNAPAPNAAAPKPAPAAAINEAAREIVVHPPNTRALGDLRPAEIQRIQQQVDASNIEIYVVGSAAKGKRRNVETDLPLATFGGGKKGTKSDIDYVVRNGQGDAATKLDLADMDGSWGVREVDYITLKNSPAIRFRPHEPPVVVEGTARLNLE